MIIRKPFAFIVQKFKLLHFITLIPVIYLIYMFFNLNNFFNRFVVDGYVTNISNAPDVYYSFLMVIACLIVIIFTSLLSALFKKKNKYYFPYLLLTLFYMAVLVFTLFTKGLLVNAVNAKIASSSALIIRSLTSIFFYGQIICLPIFILLAFGFDIRTGDFLDIKEEINLDEEDSEEVEIGVSKDNYRFKRWVNRYIREIKYYVIENKNVFKVLGGILGIIIIFFVGKYIISLTRVVRVDQAFNYSSISLSFNSSTLSTIDYAGNNIQNGKIYLAVKLSAKNLSKDLLSIQTSDFCLEINRECYYPVLDRSGKFIDIAVPYYGEKLGQGVGHEYVLVYELDEKLSRSKYKIKILDKLTYKENEVIAQYKEINLRPSFTSTVVDVQKNKIGEEINFNKSNLLNTTLNVSKFEFLDNYRYYYDYCYKDNCIKSMDSLSISNNNTFLVLDALFNMDEKATYFKNTKSRTAFFKDFVTIKYRINGTDYVASVSDRTPKDVTNQIVLETMGVVKKADKVDLLITIRDKRYTLELYNKEG